jgi:hypothetical protein
MFTEQQDIFASAIILANHTVTTYTTAKLNGSLHTTNAVLIFLCRPSMSVLTYITPVCCCDLSANLIQLNIFQPGTSFILLSNK